MQNEPTKWEDSEIFRILKAAPRPHAIVPFPRKDPITGAALFEMRINILSVEEVMAAQMAAEAWALQSAKNYIKGKDSEVDTQTAGYQKLVENALAVELLQRSCRRLEDDGRDPAFPTAKITRSCLALDEMAVLINHYNHTQASLGPIVSRMTQVEMDMWIERLGRGAAAFPLAALSSDALMDLLLHSASRLRAYETASGSSGELAESTSVPKTEEEVEADAPAYPIEDLIP